MTLSNLGYFNIKKLLSVCMSDRKTIFITYYWKTFLNCLSIDQMLFTIFIFFVYLSTSIGYFFLPADGSAFPGFIFLYTTQYVGYFFLIYRIREGNALNLKFFIGLAIAVRVLLAFSSPIIEDDYWRYLWDGRVLAHFLNPYAFAPDNPYYDSLDVFYRSKIGFKEFGTIYPPVAIAVFAIAHLVKADSLLILKLILILFDLMTGHIIWKWLKYRNQNTNWSLIYLLSPLVLKEIANSGHLDSVAVFFTTLSFYLLETNLKSEKKEIVSSFGVWVSFALAVGSKIYPIILLPLIIRFNKSWIKGFCLFLLLIFLFYLPFFSARGDLLDGTKAFAKYWLFNASLYSIFSYLINSVIEALSLPFSSLIGQEFVAKIFVGFLCAGFCLFIAKKTRHTRSLPTASSLSIGSVLLLSPVVNSWYVLWLLPFACFDSGFIWLIFSYLISMSYSWFYDPDTVNYFVLLEYAIFYSLMFFLSKKSRFSIARDFEALN